MTRDDAMILLNPHIRTVCGCQVIDHAVARELLGEVDFGRMMADPIRRCVSGNGYTYWWNVIDHMTTLSWTRNPPF